MSSEISGAISHEQQTSDAYCICALLGIFAQIFVDLMLAELAIVGFVVVCARLAMRLRPFIGGTVFDLHFRLHDTRWSNCSASVGCQFF